MHPTAYEPRMQQDHILVGMKQNSIYRVLNIKTLVENWYADMKIDEYIYPAIKEPKFGLQKGRTKPQEISSREEPPIPPPNAVKEAPQVRGRAETQTTSTNMRERATSPVVHSPGQTAAEPGDEPPISEQTGLCPESRGQGEDEESPASNGTEPRTRVVIPQASDSNTQMDGQRSHPAPQRDNKRRKPIPEPTRRSERVPKKKIFPDSIVHQANALKAMHLEGNDSLGAPIAPFEAVSMEEAMKEDAPAWLEAIKAELNSIKVARTYSIVKELPKGRTAIGCRWVLRRKYNVDGSIARLKARLVIKGYEQRYGFDYFSTFASVVRYTTLRYLLVKAAAEDLETDQLDVDTAFLNPELKEEIYMEVPEHFFMLESKMEASY
jgi:Reverse transcriptase (RNA-dependent DNA polymerase)